MKRSVLIGLAACAFAAMPSFSVSAMPMAPADRLITGTDNSVILAKSGGVGGGWGRAAVAGHPDGAGSERLAGVVRAALPASGSKGVRRICQQTQHRDDGAAASPA